MAQQRCCKYRVRRFYSKGALLVLIWTTLISATIWGCQVVLGTRINKILPRYNYVAIILPAPFYACIPFLGWMADAKYGNYKVFKFGSIVLFFAAILASTFFVFITPILGPELELLNAIVAGTMFIVVAIGATACFVAALQLGLDQMPDASSSNISSFIAWFVFSIGLGAWIADTVSSLMYNCTANKNIFSIFPPLCMTIVCCSLFILAPKWLTIEPNCPQSLKTIYQVLKFAKQHKAPLNRSALTYWEEDIPSRMDLGKSRYGGPFTAEQVEDVKTFLKILVICIPMFLTSLSWTGSMYDNMKMMSIPNSSNISSCYSTLIYSFSYSSWWSAIVTIVSYEFSLYPLLHNSVLAHSTLKGFGIAGFFTLLTSSGYLAISIISPVDLEYPHFITITLLNVLNGSIWVFLLTNMIEFVCAQSPYSMRGLLTGYVNFLVFLSTTLSILLSELIRELIGGPQKHCNSCWHEHNSIITTSLLTALAFTGFISHCLLARWYKRRVRDDGFVPQHIIEEVYDRYLSSIPIITRT